MNYGFDKSQRSTFAYWFAHWCAFQMVALNLHIWKPKYLFHDIEKPWLRLFLPYEKVQKWHREHHNHHIEYAETHHFHYDIDIDAMIIDNECSRYTKSEAQRSALQFIFDEMRRDNIDQLSKEIYSTAQLRAMNLGLKY